MAQGNGIAMRRFGAAPGERSAGRNRESLWRNWLLRCLRKTAVRGIALSQGGVVSTMPKIELRSRSGVVALLAALTIPLSACATKNAPQRQYRSATTHAPHRAAVAPRPAAAPYRAAPQAYAPVARGSSSAALLRLRAGLNVAALSCRGRGMPAVIPAYGRVLTRHKTLLASAYRSETQRLGVAGLDRQQTRIYNQFANQRSPSDFCYAASAIANQAGNMDSPRLASASSGLAAQLESRLR